MIVYRYNEVDVTKYCGCSVSRKEQKKARMQHYNSALYITQLCPIYELTWNMTHFLSQTANS